MSWFAKIIGDSEVKVDQNIKFSIRCNVTEQLMHRVTRPRVLCIRNTNSVCVTTDIFVPPKLTCSRHACVIQHHSEATYLTQKQEHCVSAFPAHSLARSTRFQALQRSPSLEIQNKLQRNWLSYCRDGIHLFFLWTSLRNSALRISDLRIRPWLC